MLFFFCDFFHQYKTLNLAQIYITAVTVHHMSFLQKIKWFGIVDCSYRIYWDWLFDDPLGFFVLNNSHKSPKILACIIYYLSLLCSDKCTHPCMKTDTQPLPLTPARLTEVFTSRVHKTEHYNKNFLNQTIPIQHNIPFLPPHLWFDGVKAVYRHTS